MSEMVIYISESHPALWWEHYCTALSRGTWFMVLFMVPFTFPFRKRHTSKASRRCCWGVFFYFILFFSNCYLSWYNIWEQILIYKHDQAERLQQQIKMYTTYIHIYIDIFKLVTSTQCSPSSTSRYFMSETANTAHCSERMERKDWNGIIDWEFFWWSSFLTQSHKLTVEGSHAVSVFSWWPQIIRKDLADSSVPILQTEWQMRNRGTAFGCVL